MLGNIGLWKKSMYGTRDASSNWECDGHTHVERCDYKLGQNVTLSSTASGRSVRNQNKDLQPRFGREHQSIERKGAAGRTRADVPA